jgi:CRP-like cAMP-binding protein
MQKLMEADEDPVQSKLRMEKYFAYLIYEQQHSWLVDKHELMEHLPISVVREIVIQTNEEIFKVIFQNIQSDNLIRELCIALESLFYLPLDYILKKGDTANEVFIIVDGTVYVYTKNSSLIALTLNAGQYFGEIAVLRGTKREYDTQAATFCLLYSLTKEKIDQIAIVYPQLRQHLEESGRNKKDLID